MPTGGDGNVLVMTTALRRSCSLGYDSNACGSGVVEVPVSFAEVLAVSTKKVLD